MVRTFCRPLLRGGRRAAWGDSEIFDLGWLVGEYQIQFDE